MKRVLFSTIVAVVVGVAGFSFASAQPDGQRGPGFGPGGRGRGGPGGFGHLARIADLTDEQRAQVRSILDEERGTRQGPPPAAALRQQLEAEILADAPDDQKIDALRQQLVQAQGEALAKQIAVQRRIAQVLTPEQRAKARERVTDTSR